MKKRKPVEESVPLTQHDLIRALHYDQSTGLFTRTFKNGNAKPVGSINTKGYVCIPLNSVKYVAHRLAWLWVHGNFPNGQIDHINGDKQDNRIANLRVVTNKQNCENKPLQKNSTSGFVGVNWKASANKWVAQICHNQHVIYLGLFNKIEEAIAVRRLAQRALFTHSKEVA
jgi:hypothetical protein